MDCGTPRDRVNKRVEITCPCCDKYKHVTVEEMAKLQYRKPPDKMFSMTDILCEGCYAVVLTFLPRKSK